MTAAINLFRNDSLRFRRSRVSSAITLFLAFAVFSGCQTPATTLDPAWVDDSQKDVAYAKIVVIGAFSRDTYTGLVEGDLVKQFQALKITADAGNPVIKSLGFRATKQNGERVGRALKARGYDGVLVLRFLELDRDIERTEPASVSIETGKVGRLTSQRGPIGYYESGSAQYYTFRTFDNYQAETKRTVYDPGKFEVTSTSVVFETNFYSLKTGKLIWTARSTTVDPRSASAFSRSFSAAVVESLIQDRVLQPGGS